MSGPLPPHLHGTEGELDETAERVVSALAALFGAPRWRVTDDRSGEFVASKMRAASAEIAEAEADAAEYRERIDAWLEDRTRRARGTVEWATFHLSAWLRELNDADPKVKSRKLPSAVVSSREGSVEWTVTDPEALLDWATGNGLLDELFELRPRGVAALKAALTPVEKIGLAMSPDGVPVAGVEVHRKPRTFTVKPA